MFNEEDDEEATLGAVRYPVMPSLVALQQMRNRLHLAYLGKKLMKWTAMATNKELRRIAMEISNNLKEYGTIMQTGFILLARSRYFVPHMNSTVLECIPHVATITVKRTQRSVSGVKVHNLVADDSEIDPYPYLGLNNGGMCIGTCKNLWEHLIKLMILIVQYKITFVQIEIANKNANKNRRKIAKEVIPRIIATINFIENTMTQKEKTGVFKTDKKIIKKIANDILRQIVTEYLNERIPLVNKNIDLIPSNNYTEENNFLNFDTNIFDFNKMPEDDETVTLNCSILPFIRSVKEYERIENIKNLTNTLNGDNEQLLDKSSQTDFDDKHTQINTPQIIMPVFIKHNYVTPFVCEQLTRTKYQMPPNTSRENRRLARENKNSSSITRQSKTRKGDKSSSTDNQQIDENRSSLDRQISSSDQLTVPLNQKTLANSRQTMTDVRQITIPGRPTVRNSRETASSGMSTNSKQTSASGPQKSEQGFQTVENNRQNVETSMRPTKGSRRTMGVSRRAMEDSRSTVDSNRQNVVSSQQIERASRASQRSMNRSQQTVIRSRKVLDKDHHIKKHSRITTTDPPKGILSKKSSTKSHKPSHEFKTAKNKSQSVQSSEKLQQKSGTLYLTPLNESSRASNVDSLHKVPSKVASIIRRLMKMLPKKPKKQDLIVLKGPEEVETGHDEFIPPVVGKKGTTMETNIVRVEDLGEYLESASEAQNDDNPFDLNLDGEAFETGEWFEIPDVDKIFESPITDVSSESGLVFDDKGTGVDDEFYSKHNIPIKQCSEKHFLPVTEDMAKDSRYLSENFQKVLDHLKISQGPSLNEFKMDKRLIKYLDDKFNSADDLDEGFKEQVRHILNANENKDKKTNRAYEYIIDSKSSEESEDLNDLLDNMIDKRNLQFDLKAIGSKKSAKFKPSSNISKKSFHKK